MLAVNRNVSIIVLEIILAWKTYELGDVILGTAWVGLAVLDCVIWYKRRNDASKTGR